MTRDRATAGRSLRLRLLEAALLLVAAALFGRVCTLPLALAQGARLAATPPAWLLPLDDAYIFVRYAEQAARGRPWQWSSGEASTGSSSALFPWLLVPIQWVSRDLAVWSRWSRLIGVASLWALGLAAVRALRAARAAEPWPLAGGLCLVWSGPVGFGAIAGMESAANAALLVLACALWMESLEAAASGAAVARRVRVGALLLTALLPLGRPENAAVTLVAALALFGGRLPWRRWSGFAVLLPGALLALADRLATGYFEPAGALAKSWLGLPFLPLSAKVQGYLAVARHGLLPVYLGAEPTALWPPVGVLAVGTAAMVLFALFARLRGGAGDAADRRLAPAPLAPLAPLARPASQPPMAPLPSLAPQAPQAPAPLASLAPLAPIAIAWLVLAALAPFSILLLWQEMRHHHAGLALAWLLAVAGCSLGCEALAGRLRRGSRPGGSGAARSSRWRALPLLLPLPLLLALPHWARESTRAAFELYRGHARAAAWLADHARGQTVLLSDAGLLAIAHDGPAIDALGLCTPGLTEPSLNGPGAVVEALARRRPLPAIAAVDPALLKVPQLLGEPLLPGAPLPGEITALVRVRRDLLAGTPRQGPGLDFAYLPDERRYRLRWEPPPLPPRSTVALLLPGPGDDSASAGAGGGAEAKELALRGCRPLFGRVGLELPPGAGGLRLRATVLAPARAGEVLAGAGGAEGPDGPPLASARLAPDRWSEVPIVMPAGARVLWMARSGAGVPCLQSVRFVGRGGGGG